MPPQSRFSVLLGIEIVTCTPAEVVCTMTVTEDMANRNGVLHGGALMTLSDTAAGTASFISSPAEISNTTVEAKTNFIRPVKLGDIVTARCEPLHVGRATSVLQVTMTRGDGKIVGVTTQTHLFLGWKD
ncbi:PaaI family thioesterase [uncultured Paracoccus sp.]|nr:PaaI family thioesterase [uncultured Paracoccus sp.]